MRNLRKLPSLIALMLIIIPQTVFSGETNPEHLLYAKVIESYRQGDSLLLNKSVRLFLKTYPKSVHADNSLYLNGLLALSKENYKRASKNFSLLQKYYPNGNKLPSAMVGRGIALRKLGKKETATKIFESVRKKYPGSPEYFQSDFQLKILK
ncbi:MAG: outer membrane protein assembly factor BamD [Pseudomonadota bacterium]|nr:outer membrane protein assembly factor BamD [Pseudomonadota bacterium]